MFSTSDRPFSQVETRNFLFFQKSNKDYYKGPAAKLRMSQAKQSDRKIRRKMRNYFPLLTEANMGGEV